MSIQTAPSPERTVQYMAASLENLAGDDHHKWYQLYHAMPVGLREYIGHNSNEAAADTAKRVVRVVRTIDLPFPDDAPLPTRGAYRLTAATIASQALPTLQP